MWGNTRISFSPPPDVCSARVERTWFTSDKHDIRVERGVENFRLSARVADIFDFLSLCDKQNDFNYYYYRVLTGESSRKCTFRASLPAGEPFGSGLFRPGVHQRREGEILVGSWKADEPTIGIVADGSSLAIRRQVLCPRSGAAWRGIYPLPLLYANQTGFGLWDIAMQR